MKKQDLQTGYQLSSLEYWTAKGYTSSIDLLAIVSDIDNDTVASKLFTNIVMYDQTKNEEYIYNLSSACFDIAISNAVMYEGYILHKLFMSIIDGDTEEFEEFMRAIEDINYTIHCQILTDYNNNNDCLSEELTNAIIEYIF